MSICPQCKQKFEVTDDDKKFLEDVSPTFNNKKYLIPEPTLCPDCRQQRRLSWKNERKFHKCKCDLCHKQILSMYRADAPFPVYCLDCWWSDNWDATKYGCEPDFNKPFFEQFIELRDKVPHFCLANLHQTMENSDFCNHVGYLKNCYLIVNSDQSEQCMYGKGINRCFNCMDCFKVYDCQACYECINCNNCAFSSYLLDSYTCDNCHFSSNLIGCKHCFGCINLRNKEYYFFNERLSAKEYEQKIAQLKSAKTTQEIWNDFRKFRANQPTRWMQEKNTENCTGEYLINCKNCTNCFDSEYLEECKNCTDLKKGDKVSYKNQDISYFGMNVDYSYEGSILGYKTNHALFCKNVWECNEAFYSQLCTNNCHDIFGCVGLKHANYCILNKKYSKEEYEKLAGKIVEHMIADKTFGEFFPIKFSQLSYNETTACEYFPLTKDQVIKNGWPWHDAKEPDYSGVTKKIPADQIPRDINKVSDEILDWAIECTESHRLFKIQSAELNFYKTMKLPIPLFHPDVRHFRRLALRRPRKLYDRTCDKCNNKITSSFSSKQPEKVYCEKCYLTATF